MRGASLIGLISDTHGLLRPEAVRALEGCELIIHAGDVGKPEIIESLQTIARVIAVRGNVDKGEWASRLPETAVVEAQGAAIYVLHDVHQLDLDPAAAGFGIVRWHRPRLSPEGAVAFENGYWASLLDHPPMTFIECVKR